MGTRMNKPLAGQIPGSASVVAIHAEIRPPPPHPRASAHGIEALGPQEAKPEAKPAPESRAAWCPWNIRAGVGHGYGSPFRLSEGLKGSWFLPQLLDAPGLLEDLLNPTFLCAGLFQGRAKKKKTRLG